MLPGFWVDNDANFLQHNIPNFERSGLRIEPFRSGEEALRRFADDRWAYGYGILDLDLDPGEMDGVDLICQIRSIDPTFPLLLTSAHRMESVWQGRLDLLGEEIPGFDKPLPVSKSPDFAEMVKEIRDRGEERSRVAVFQRPLAEFLALPEEQRDELAREAATLAETDLEAHFREHPEIGWVAIAGAPDCVVASGPLGAAPLPEEIESLALRQGVPVFSYLRSPSGETTLSGEGGNAAVAPDVLASGPEGAGMQPVEAQIDALYDEIRDLGGKSEEEPELREEITRRIERLRLLQRKEAAELRRRFEARRLHKPGTGLDLLRRIDEWVPRD